MYMHTDTPGVVHSILCILNDMLRASVQGEALLRQGKARTWRPRPKKQRQKSLAFGVGGDGSGFGIEV